MIILQSSSRSWRISKFSNRNLTILRFLFSALRSSLSTSRSFSLHEPPKSSRRVLQLGLIQAGVHADEERVLHNEISIVEIAHDPVLDTLEGGMPKQVAAEEVSRLDPIELQESREVIPRKARIITDGDDKSEPGRVGVLRRLRQD